MNTRKLSDIQEKAIAKKIGGKVTSNSGGTKFGGGDILTDTFLIEAKTCMKDKKSFSIKKDHKLFVIIYWMEKFNTCLLSTNDSLRASALE